MALNVCFDNICISKLRPERREKENENENENDNERSQKRASSRKRIEFSEEQDYRDNGIGNSLKASGLIVGCCFGWEMAQNGKNE